VFDIKVRISSGIKPIALIQVAESTHPVYASLDHPLFACGRKRVKKKERKPLYARSGERGDKRSDVGVR